MVVKEGNGWASRIIAALRLEGAFLLLAYAVLGVAFFFF
jgi:hypothetical protein